MIVRWASRAYPVVPAPPLDPGTRVHGRRNVLEIQLHARHEVDRRRGKAEYLGVVAVEHVLHPHVHLLIANQPPADSGIVGHRQIEAIVGVMILNHRSAIVGSGICRKSFFEHEVYAIEALYMVIFLSETYPERDSANFNSRSARTPNETHRKYLLPIKFDDESRRLSETLGYLDVRKMPMIGLQTFWLKKLSSTQRIKATRSIASWPRLNAAGKSRRPLVNASHGVDGEPYDWMPLAVFETLVGLDIIRIPTQSTGSSIRVTAPREWIGTNQPTRSQPESVEPVD